MSQNPAQIYKSALRGKLETDYFRSFSVFNFGTYCEDSRKPFGALKVFNDETLAAGQSVSMTVDKNSDILLLPLLGALDYMDTLGNQDVVNTEEVRIFSAGKAMAFEVLNSYEGERINCLQMWISNQSENFVPFSYRHQFDFTLRNHLAPVYESAFAYCRIGAYDYRHEGFYNLRNKGNGVFAFVIIGMFEFGNAILDTNDSMSIAPMGKVTFTARSENAVVLMLEVPLIG